MKKILFIIIPLLFLIGFVVKKSDLLASLDKEMNLQEEQQEQKQQEEGENEEEENQNGEDEEEEEDEDENNTVPASEIVWGSKSRKEVIFTFDGGSGTHSFDEILQTLSDHNVKGTFFLTGKWAEENPELTKEIVQEGHEIFNHTYSHPYLTQSTDQKILQEFQQTETIIKNLTGVSTKPYFRPPYGDRNQHVFNVASGAGYQAVYWTVDVLDWKEELGFTAQEARSRILNNLSPGTIYLMHIGDNITGDILDDVFTQIKNQGYDIVSLTQNLD